MADAIADDISLTQEGRGWQQDGQEYDAHGHGYEYGSQPGPAGGCGRYLGRFCVQLASFYLRKGQAQRDNGKRGASGVRRAVGICGLVELERQRLFLGLRVLTRFRLPLWLGGRVSVVRALLCGLERFVAGSDLGLWLGLRLRLKGPLGLI